MTCTGGISAGIDKWQRAFELGYFIHRDRSIARRIAVEAMDRLETVAAHQNKRLSYRAVGRSRSGTRLRPRRDKITFDRATLLQYLVLRESELRELDGMTREPDEHPTEEDRIVRFVAQLVRITLPRNAFHVCIGIGRLLYRYETDELARLYDVLAQDPEHYRSSDYFRARKKVLMRELIRYFGTGLRQETLVHGERALESRAPSAALCRLVTETLDMLAPWGASCALPSTFEPTHHELPAFRFLGPDPDLEHSYELRRVHSILHPPCFAALTAALGLDAPQQRLAVPKLFGTAAAGSGSPDRYPSPLTEGERRGMENELESRSVRRAG